MFAKSSMSSILLLLLALFLVREAFRTHRRRHPQQ